MEEWESGTDYGTANDTAPKPPPPNNVYYYVVGALVLVLFLIVNSAPSYEVVVDPNAHRATRPPVEVQPPAEVPLEAQPVEPTQPIEAQPVEPAPPAQPAHPVQPAPPVQPAQPGSSLSDQVASLRPSVVYLFYNHGGGRASGSGFVIDNRGRIATNAHVVAHTDTPSVMTHTGQSYSGRVLARSQHDDLAIVQADLPADVPAVRLGDSDHIRIGDDILVFGFPLGLFSEVTVTPGIVSSIRREENLVQLSAPVNKGNSGGPVFARGSGEVVAVVVAKHAVGEAIGFAIPVNRLKIFLEESGR